MLGRKVPGWNLAGKKLVSNCETPFPVPWRTADYNGRSQF
jgi:hypothetical protein